MTYGVSLTETKTLKETMATPS